MVVRFSHILFIWGTLIHILSPLIDNLIVWNFFHENIGTVVWVEKHWLNYWLILPWWRHQMETFSALLALCGIYRSPVNSPHKGQWRGALIFFFDLRLNKRLSKQSWGWWFETPPCSLWRHCNDAGKWTQQHLLASHYYENHAQFSNQCRSLYSSLWIYWWKCPKNEMKIGISFIPVTKEFKVVNINC